MALYLKCSAVCLQRYYGRTFDPHLALPFPVSNTRSGIPRCIPSFHRHMSLRRDEKADKLVKFYLSLFSLFQLVRFANFKKSLPSPVDLLLDFKVKVNVSSLLKGIFHVSSRLLRFSDYVGFLSGLHHRFAIRTMIWYHVQNIDRHSIE